MVEGRPDQAHRPGHVREDLIPKKPDGTGGAGSRPARSHGLFQRCASAHRRCPGQGRRPAGNDSLFKGRSVTLGYRFHGGRKTRKDK